MPLDPLELLSAERENFPFLLKCRIRFAIQMSGAYDWKYTAAKSHLMNWRRKKNRGRNKRKVKEVVIVFLKKDFKIHLVNFWPLLSSSCLPSQTWHSPFIPGLVVLSQLSFLHSVPESEHHRDTRPTRGWLGCSGHFVRLLCWAFSRTAYAKYSK